MNTKLARIGFAVLVGTILTAGLCSDAVAKARKGHLHGHHVHAHHVIYESRAQLVTQQPVRLGPMRYYGGPKSPMWRGPVEN
jgi:hypothetical protein